MQSTGSKQKTQVHSYVFLHCSGAGLIRRLELPSASREDSGMMSAEDGQQAVEQLVILMKSEVLLHARRQRQRSNEPQIPEARGLSARSDGVVYTRVLGKQESFHIASDSW